MKKTVSHVRLPQRSDFVIGAQPLARGAGPKVPVKSHDLRAGAPPSKKPVEPGKGEKHDT